MNIRYADMSDLAAVTAVEAACFPPAEAATQQDFAQRLRYYSGHFWLMFDGGYVGTTWDLALFFLRFVFVLLLLVF